MDTPWIVALALGLVVVALVVVLVVRQRRARAELAVRIAQHEADVRRARDEHESAAERAAREATARIAAVEAEREAAREQEQKVRDFFAHGAKNEAASRAMISAVCRDLGVDGVLVTNLVFLPDDAAQDRPYVAQVDHVLLLHDAAIVIENKHWRGVVLDGVQPGEVHRSLAALLGDDELVAPFAVQLKRKTPVTVELLVAKGTDSPCWQVRRQAQRVSDLVADGSRSRTWFDTCVLYSHRDVQLYARPTDAAPGGAVTHVAGGMDRLREVVQEVRRQRRTRATVPVRQLAATFASHGAELRGFGVHEDLTTAV